jgi:Calx-beta domain
MANFTVSEGGGTATIVATRTGGSGGFFTVNYATANGSALAGTNYLPASGSFTFNPGVVSQSFTITIINNGLPSPNTTVLLGLSNPTGPIALGPQNTAVLTILGNQSQQNLTNFYVTNTNDSGPGSLRQAILMANAAPANSPATIQFAIPASTAPDLDVPVSGFDPTTQTWRIALDSPLPAITHQVTIDGYTQGQTGIPYRYPSQQASQMVTIAGNPTGGTFTLTTSAPLPVGTATLPFNATNAQVQAALAAIVGPNCRATPSASPSSASSTARRSRRWPRKTS